MYYKTIESDAGLKAKINEAMKKEAGKRIRDMDHERRAECAPNRKAKAKLDGRIKDFNLSIATMKDSSGYNKPGSLQR